MAQNMAESVLHSDFEFSGVSTSYATHGIHPYVATMVPALARHMVAETKPSALLDPFCGGAVCVEGVLASVPTAGLDINPLSAVLTGAKTAHLRPFVIMDQHDKITEATSTNRTLNKQDNTVWVAKYSKGVGQGESDVVASKKKRESNNE